VELLNKLIKDSKGLIETERFQSARKDLFYLLIMICDSYSCYDRWWYARKKCKHKRLLQTMEIIKLGEWHVIISNASNCMYSGNENTCY